ncbi:MAG: acetylornithine deacetylase [Pseudomonadota bacterium]
MTGDLARTTEILRDLIGFPTISKDSNLALIDYASDLLGGLGTEITLSRDATGAKANLFATIGPDVDGGIVLSGHSDVVPVAGQDWSGNPFGMVERDGALYGRGACDMKGFIACVLALAPRFANASLTRPIHIALTYDEETGCLGAPVLLEALAASGRKPAICIIGEPTEMRIIEGHKGCYEYTTRFEGLEGHGSAPDCGVNAVEYAARYIGELIATGEALKSRAPEGSRFDPPHTTVSVGRIEGGIAHNVIPNTCAVDWEFRPVNASDAAYVRDRMHRHTQTALLPGMRAVHPQAAVTTEVIGEVDGLEPLPHSEAVDLVTELTGGNARDLVAFGTEAGLFQQHGISTVVCGPGSIAQAHKPDEFVTLDQLTQCLAMLDRLIPKLSD